MSVVAVQAVFPEISCYKSDNNSSAYRVFGANGIGTSGKNLLSCSWKRSRDEFSGQFNFTVKEDVSLPPYSESNTARPFLDMVEPMDVIAIKNDSTSDKYDFIGIVTDISVSATAGSFQKSISISGKSIEHLFEMYCISLDATAMQWAGESANTQSLQNNFVASLSSKSDSVTIKDTFMSIYKQFDDVAKKHPGVSNTRISQMIDTWFDADYIDCDKDLKFKMPISSNLFSDSVVKLPDYVRNLLPQPVYEFYGTVKNGKPVVVIRENPFDHNDWKELDVFHVDADYLTSYALTRSNGEVYTVFIPYVAGSVLDQNFYQVQSTKEGYPHSAVDKEKLAVYGYRPLNCNFVGFKTEGTPSDTLTEVFKELAERLKTWYGKLDEMYDANLAMVLSRKTGMPQVGQRLAFARGEFYVTGTDFSWSYGGSPTVKVRAERGAYYAGGAFSMPLDGLSRPHVEMAG